MLPETTKLWDHPSWIGLEQKKDERDVHKVWEIKTMKEKPREEHARKILEEVARQVEPIMMKHKWRVKRLSEFCDGRILGVNDSKGCEIKLRVRISHRHDKFSPFIRILDTMLHELCHNVYSFHDARFHKLFSELKEEYYELVAEGIIKASSPEFDVRPWTPFPPQPAPKSMLDDMKQHIKATYLHSSERKTLLAVGAKISQFISLLLSRVKPPR